VLAEQALTDTFGREHAVVQLPQWFSSVTSFTQLPEQLVSPVPHVVEHDPDEQTCPPPHTFRQLPQLPLSVCVLTSHPFAGFPSQSAKPALQAPIPQTPSAQVAPAFGKLHLIPQPPQLFTSLERTAVSHPLAALPSQSPKPFWQAPTTQVLDEHASTETFGSAHAAVQLPQWLTSVTSFTQLPEQLISPEPQVVAQDPEEHTWPPPQAFLQLPQFALSLCVLTSHPFAGLPSQSAKPVLQAPIPQAPAAHVAPAFG
jgi:hypothetical protein